MEPELPAQFPRKNRKGRSRRSWPWWRWVLTGLTALPLALSLYLCRHDLLGGSVIGCGGGSPCDQVLGSRWSSIGGVLPVSGLAAGAYLAMLVAGLSIGPATAAPVRRLAWDAMLVLGGAIAGSAIWFTIVQKWILGAFCPLCMATHSSGVLLVAFVIWRAPAPCRDEDRHAAPANRGPARDVDALAPRCCHGRLHALRRVLVGVALAGILATSQVVLAPPVAYRDGETTERLPAMDPRTVPLVGSPDAPHVVTLLFDYQCSHCQQMHFLLDGAVRRYAGKLAFALCPAPLSSQCNPYVPQDVDAYKDSCELANVALAVWVARPEAFHAFQDWMFSFESGDRWRPRTLDAAQTKAVALVGREPFDAARADPWIDRHLQTSIQLFGDTGGNAVPKLVFGSRWVLPAVQDADDLVLLLQNILAVPRP
jgi:uncharacterized membrane protein